jgi:hypothetical protein
MSLEDRDWYRDEQRRRAKLNRSARRAPSGDGLGVLWLLWMAWQHCGKGLPS